MSKGATDPAGEREEAERLELALDAGAIVGTWVWDLPAGRFSADERFAQTFGLDPELCREGLQSDDVFKLIHDDDRARARAQIVAALRDGGPYRCDYRIRRPDGSYRWIEASGRVTLGPDGRALRFPGILLDIQPRRDAEAERDCATALLEMVIEAVPGVVYAKDREGRLLLGNRGTSELLGKPPALYLSRTDVEVLGNPAEAEEIMANDRRIMESGVSEQIEELVQRADGTPAVWLSTKAPLRDARGEVIGLIGSSVDITERKAAVVALRADQARLRFLDRMNRAVASSVEAGDILAITTRMLAEHLGVARSAYADVSGDGDWFTIRGEFSRETLPSRLGRYQLSSFGAQAVATLSAGEVMVVNDSHREVAPERLASLEEIEVVTAVCVPLVKDGRLTALMAAHDKVPHAWTQEEVALVREVAERSWAHVERAAAQAELRELNATLEARAAERTAAYETSENTIRTVFETSYMSQGLLTTEGKIVYANATALADIDATFEEVVGRDFWDAPWFTGTPGISEQMREAVRRAASGESIHLAMALTLPAGERLYEFSLRPAFDEAGAVIALVPEAVEVTARVRAEEALRQAQKMEAVGQLTGGIAHDFNNLLGAISGNLELLQNRLGRGQMGNLERYIERAQEGARRAAALTQRLLAFARRQTLDPRVIDVNRLVASTAELLRQTTGPEVEFEIVADDELWTTRIDPSQLENALLNLCINARDAMAPAGGLITIATANERLGPAKAVERDLVAGDYVAISVSDGGTGMAPEVIERAFDPFFTTKPLGEGTGLGLSMVYGFARQSGGQARIRSELGKGTTVQLFLPRFDGETYPAAEPVEPAERRGEGETVLVVDDEPAIRALVIESLEDCGYVAVEAEDSLAALAILQSDARVDLLITDVGLPGGMNGRQLADAARVSRPALRILFITGFAESTVMRGGDLGAGMAIVTKPFAIATLIGKIRALVEG
jgi:PAS domain S-box-containing protein